LQATYQWQRKIKTVLFLASDKQEEMQKIVVHTSIMPPSLARIVFLDPEQAAKSTSLLASQKKLFNRKQFEFT
jgi:hypothetical protein